MSNFAIQIENLGKMYRIGGPQEKYKTLRDSITNVVSAPFNRARSLLRGQAYGAAGLEEEIWALKDVSFEVKHGEVMGIIGHNGAGKSTLLKILSRITEPSEGYVDIYGRVGALLEVGTGFHQELTGRENVYLNGAILGMSREEIDRKFDEIVEFAGVGKFIDTPVKYYSSGMGLRLGFAVAAHLEPEILVVDEVLAVGDVEFQQKCLGKMSDVASQGRTVLFVSHNLPAVKQLCSKGVILNQGKVNKIGKIDEIIAQYVKLVSPQSHMNLSQRKSGATKLDFRFIKIMLVDKFGDAVSSLSAGDPIRIVIEYDSPHEKPLSNVSIASRIEDVLGQYIFSAATKFTGDDFRELPPSGVLICDIPHVPLLEGTYRIFMWSSVDKKRADVIENSMEFSVIQADVYGTGIFPIKSRHGLVFVPHSWEHHDGRVDAFVNQGSA